MIQIGAERLPCELPRLLGLVAFASENRASVFVAQNAVQCPVCFRLGVSYPILASYSLAGFSLLGLHPTLGTSSVTARELLGPWSAFVPVGGHGLRELRFESSPRYLHTSNVKNLGAVSPSVP